jgi:hypothetical protein
LKIDPKGVRLCRSNAKFMLTRAEFYDKDLQNTPKSGCVEKGTVLLLLHSMPSPINSVYTRLLILTSNGAFGCHGYESLCIDDLIEDIVR